MKPEKVLIECKPAIITRMKNDPSYLIQYVDEYLASQDSKEKATKYDSCYANMQNYEQEYFARRREEMLHEMTKIKTKLRKLKVNKVRFCDEDEQYGLTKSLLKIMKRIDKLTEKMSQTSTNMQEDTVTVIYEQPEWIGKLKDWQKLAD